MTEHNGTIGMTDIIKALTALVGRLSLSVGWENGPERGRKTDSLILNFLKFKQTMQTLIRRRSLNTTRIAWLYITVP